MFVFANKLLKKQSKRYLYLAMKKYERIVFWNILRTMYIVVSNDLELCNIREAVLKAISIVVL